MSNRTSFSSNGVGTLTKDPVVKNVANTKVAELSLVFNEYYGKDEQGQPKINTSYFNFEAWDTAAEYLSKYAKKGDSLYVETSPRQEKWVKDEQTREKIFFRINKFIIFPKNATVKE